MFRDLATFGAMIRLEHTLFALPFALLSACYASNRGWPEWGTLGWICLAMVSARSAAMGFNRLVDARFDAANPRTAGRALPQGRISSGAVAAIVLACAALFVASAAALNEFALALSPVALLIVLGYSYTKRFTSLSHFVLGLGLACAPMGAWIGVRGSFAAMPALFALAVLLWVAGFDILYACQDVAADEEAGLHSIPRRLGIPAALRLAAFLHLVTVAVLVAAVPLFGLGRFYAVGCAVIGGLLAYEHWIVRPDDLRRVNEAFFAVNACVGAILLAAGMGDLWF